jgi:ubiquinone/menaquinone biosynthesis C-methylase UbiE
MEIKYDNHEGQWRECLSDKEMHERSLLWMRQSETLDGWRHHRYYKLISPIINKNESWLTVGDGRYGSDAHALINLGIENVHASDISDVLLKKGAEIGFISEYSQQNAENLTFISNRFQYVFCKEALHHCPRPYLALAEMWRVAENGVILVEPIDQEINPEKFYAVYKYLKKITGKYSSHSFEEVGNYVYSLSVREIEKFLLGIHQNIFAYKELNDAHKEGIDRIFKGTQKYNLEKNILKLKLIIQDIFCKLGLRKKSMCAFILFKRDPSEELLNRLKSEKWKIQVLPKNPYV